MGQCLNIRIKRNGVTRIVLLVWKYAFKIPNFSVEHRHFLYGCYANWSERVFSKQVKKTNPDLEDMIAPSLFCSWFGLIQIQQRCEEISSFDDIDLSKYNDLCGGDNKIQNFGLLNGKIVCLDYP